VGPRKKQKPGKGDFMGAEEKKDRARRGGYWEHRLISRKRKDISASRRQRRGGARGACKRRENSK